MTNIEQKIEGNTLILRIDLSKRNGRSKSGKTTIIASTGGNVPILAPDGSRVFLGVNAYVTDATGNPSGAGRSTCGFPQNAGQPN
jgi:hypothetical protein